MNTGKTLFAQLMDFLPWSSFTRIVSRYGGNHAMLFHTHGIHSALQTTLIIKSYCFAAYSSQALQEKSRRKSTPIDLVGHVPLRIMNAESL
jgi:hypothetical protein